MSFPLVEISQCCKVINGSTPSRVKPEYWNGEIDWVTPKDLSKLDSKYFNEAPEKITELGYKSCSTTIVPVGSLLYTSRAPIGHLAITQREICTNQGFKTLVPNDNVDVEFLYYVLKKHTPKLQDLGNGATFKELSKATISSYKIPLPPLDQQKKIAAILDAADAYRQKTKALITKYDALTQSLFLDMFGDPVRNPMGWEKKPLKEISNISSGSTPSRKIEEYFTGNIPWVKTGEVNSKIILDTEEKISENALKNSSCKLYPKGSLIIAMYGQGKTRGQVGLLGIDASTNQACAVLTKSDNANFSFLYKLMQMSYKDLRSLGRGGNQPNLNSGILKNYLVLNPPLKLQNQFAERIQAIEAQKAQAEASLAGVEDLFNSLLQRAFKGELTN